MKESKTLPLFFASLFLSAVFSVLLPVLGLFSAIILPAIYGVCIAQSRAIPVILSPLPGVCLAGFIWRDPLVPVLSAACLLIGVCLAVSLRRRLSATAISAVAAAAYALVIGGALCAAAVANFGSVSSAIDAIVEFVTSYVKEVLRLASETDTTGTLAKNLSVFSVERYVASMVMILPGTFIAFCEVLGYVLSHAARLLIRMLPVSDGLYPEKRRIALPASVGVLFLVSFTVGMFSGDSLPHYVAENLNTVLCPPLFVMGLGAMANMLRLFPVGKKVGLILFTVIIFFISPPAGVYSVCVYGMFAAFADYFQKKRIK